MNFKSFAVVNICMTEYVTRNELRTVARAGELRDDIRTYGAERNGQYAVITTLGVSELFSTALAINSYNDMLSTGEPLLPVLGLIAAVTGSVSSAIGAGYCLLQARRSNRDMTAAEDKLRELMASEAYTSILG